MSLKICQKGDTWELEIKELFDFESHEECMEFISFLTKLKIDSGKDDNSDRKSMLKEVFKTNEDFNSWIRNESDDLKTVNIGGNDYPIYPQAPFPSIQHKKSIWDVIGRKLSK